MDRRGTTCRVQGAGLSNLSNIAHFTLHIARLTVIATLATTSSLSAQWLSPDTLALPPAGYGRMVQEDVSLDIRTDELIIRIQPVHPVTLRVIPRDSHDRLTALLEANEDAIADGSHRTGSNNSGLLAQKVRGCTKAYQGWSDSTLGMFSIHPAIPELNPSVYRYPRFIQIQDLFTVMWSVRVMCVTRS